MAAKFKIAGKKFDIGQKLNLKEIQTIAGKTQATPADIRKKAATQSFGIGQGAKDFAPAATSPSVTPPSVDFPYTVTAAGAFNEQPGMTREQASDYLYQSGLLTLQGNIEKEIQALKSAGDIKSKQLDVEASKYIADKDYLSATDVAKIRTEGDLRLQDIINAGLRDVEGIRQEGGKEIARISGEYGVKQESERQRGQKDIARLGAQSSYRNALIGAFSF